MLPAEMQGWDLTVLRRELHLAMRSQLLVVASQQPIVHAITCWGTAIAWGILARSGLFRITTQWCNRR